MGLYGGDLRIARLAELLSDEHTVFIYGQEKYHYEKEMHFCKSLAECLDSCNIIISGVPLSKDNVIVNAPYSNQEIRLDEIYLKLENKTFIAGGIPVQFYENKTIKNIDLLQSESLTILNAIPTAEGTIKIAIEETDITIHKSEIMIFGYGRIGKILCQNMRDLGAKVYCVARKEADLAWINQQGCIPTTYREVENKVKNIDIIINTVPSLVIEEKVMKNLKQSCIIIDVASNPGGVDKNIAKRYKIKVITALGIPGKIAPLTAAKYIKETIEKEL